MPLIKIENKQTKLLTTNKQASPIVELMIDI